MKLFETPLAFAEHLLNVATSEGLALQAGLKQVAKGIEKTAKAEIGKYQPEVDTFSAWEELAESTKEERVRQGFSENEPLLRTAALRESISYHVEGLEAVIGSISDVMVYHEFGTVHIPPRPVLGPAAFRNKEKIKKTIGHAAASGLIGVQRIHPLLNYDFET